MKLIKISLLIASIQISLGDCKKFNILSLNSGQYSGLLTAQFVSYMEQFAYQEARNHKCIPKRKHKRVAIYELFDMVAGSGTGAIIGASLVVKNDDKKTMKAQPNKNFADKALKFFKDEVDNIYVDDHMSIFTYCFWFLLLVGGGTYGVYYFTQRYFMEHEFNEEAYTLCEILQLDKQILNHEGSQDTINEFKEQRQNFNIELKALMQDNETDDILLQLKIKLDKIHKYQEQKTKAVEMKQLEDIKNIEKELDEEVNKYNFKQNYKWFATIVAVFFFWFVTVKILTGVNYIYLSNKDISLLEKSIIKNDFIPKNYDVDKVLTKEVLLTAWDINHRTPRFFSKWSKKNIKGLKAQDYSLSLDQMTLASAAIPLYFYPYKHNGNLYASGESVAESPSMYALQHAIDRNNQKPHEVRVVNIGNINTLAEKIESQASLVAWLKRLPSLYNPSKTHTMALMTSEILRKYGSNYHNFEISMTVRQSKALYMSKPRGKKLEYLAQQMIYQHRRRVNDLIHKIVDEKIPSQCKGVKK